MSDSSSGRFGGSPTGPMKQPLPTQKTPDLSKRSMPIVKELADKPLHDEKSNRENSGYRQPKANAHPDHVVPKMDKRK